jgi:hypothetical protein
VGLVWLTCALEWPTTAPFSLIDSVAMHETLHALGAVPDGAPNGYPDGHVRDPRDIMDRLAKQPDENGHVTAQLDPGRDDYYGHSMRLETDVADSRYLDTNPISGTPKLRIASAKLLRLPGRRLMVYARLGNVSAGRVTVRCSAKQGKRRLRVVSARYSGGDAVCFFARARRGLVSGKITVRSGQAVASRSFRFRA